MEQFLIGFLHSISLVNLVACFLGVLMGTIVGVMPGLGPSATMALSLPFTFKFGPATGIIMLAGIWFGAMYGGSTTSILVNIPGEAQSVVTCIDGYQMAKKGRAGAALAVVAVGSFIAGTIGILGLQIFAPILGDIALSFGPPEYLAFMILAFVLLSNLATESPMRGFMMLGLGLWLSTVGLSALDGIPRFTFGSDDLVMGIDYLPIIMGTFGMAEILNISVVPYVVPIIKKIRLRELYPKKEEIKRSILPIFRGSFVGFFLGLIPGPCGLISTYISYSIEKRFSKTPEKFGTGMIEGVASPESANNSSVMGAMIPFLTLGLAFNAPSAILLAALRMHGVEPGPLLFQNNPDVFWTFIAAMYIGNFMLLILNLPLVGIFARVAIMKPRVLMPIISILCLIGVYSVRNSFLDVWIMIISGIVGYFFLKWKYPLIPLVIGIILGPATESNLRKSLMMFRGDVFLFFERPIALVIFIISVAFIIWRVWMLYRERRSNINGSKVS